MELNAAIDRHSALHRGDRSRFEVELIRIPDRSAARVEAARAILGQ